MVYENISNTCNFCTSIEDLLTVKIFKNSFEFCHFKVLPYSLARLLSYLLNNLISSQRAK